MGKTIKRKKKSNERISLRVTSGFLQRATSATDNERICNE